MFQYPGMKSEYNVGHAKDRVGLSESIYAVQKEQSGYLRQSMRKEVIKYSERNINGKLEKIEIELSIETRISMCLIQYCVDRINL